MDWIQYSWNCALLEKELMCNTTFLRLTVATGESNDRFSAAILSLKVTAKDKNLSRDRKRKQLICILARGYNSFLQDTSEVRFSKLAKMLFVRFLCTFTLNEVWEIKGLPGPDYMSQAGPVSWPALVCRDDFQPGIPWGEPARPMGDRSELDVGAKKG